MHYTCTLRSDSLSHLEVRSITRAITINKWYPLSRYCLSARARYAIFGASTTLSFPTNFMITMRYYSYSAIYLREWRLNVLDEAARTEKKKCGWIIHPLASRSIAMKNWAASMHDGIKFRYRYHRRNRSRYRRYALIHMYMRRPMDFLRGITFVVCNVITRLIR